MVLGTIVDKHKSPIAVERLWKALICDAHNFMPKALPQVISSIDLLEGDGGVGTIKKFNFTEVVKEFRYVKDRVEIMDNENHVFRYSIVEGGILGFKVNSYVAEVTFTSSSDGDCFAKLKIEYESLGDSLLSEEDVRNIKQGIQTMVKAAERFLLANPNAYAQGLEEVRTK
ncbi:hypothetical protein CICLE_v10006674mg [Citrus x clementina]|uniref:Bet v I/Major latex protein domain-containing protein n=1 Tax=Citrus clementina TaxID=85681 RepID=V4RY59_CITCL|nr:major pollen allergen Bet v 1-D/H [Citrus x clementina]ESR32712.1 hypothetical protein CICLE_v10006674mg [Citrus x clementina]